jgi:partitioning defective protein 3
MYIFFLYFRYKKATGKPRSSWVSVHSLKAKEGGILDPDDRLVDVCDDREQLIAFYDEEGVPQGGDGMSASSDESETTSGGNKATDIEVNSEQSSNRGLLQVRRGSEPSLNKLQGADSDDSTSLGNAVGGYDEQKRWSAAVLNRDVRSSRNDLSIIAEASFYGDSNFDPGGGKLSPLPPPFERGRGSGAARDSDRPLPFNRDANRLSIQICHEDGRWLEAAERAALAQFQQGANAATNTGGLPAANSVNRQRSIDAKIKLFENAAVNQRREPLGGTSPPHLVYKKSSSNLTQVVIQNEIGPLGIHVVPSGDPANPGLTIQGIEPGGRIDRDGRLAVHDRIIEINGYSLLELPFSKAQEIFKEALFANELQLVVVKSEHAGQEHRNIADFFLSDENKENIENESEHVG